MALIVHKETSPSTIVKTQQRLQQGEGLVGSPNLMKTAARLYSPPEYVPDLVESEERVHLGVDIVLAVGEAGPRPDRHHAPLLELLTLCRHRTLRKPGYFHLEDIMLFLTILGHQLKIRGGPY